MVNFFQKIISVILIVCLLAMDVYAYAQNRETYLVSREAREDKLPQIVHPKIDDLRIPH